jgi:tetratricopeptide (TPR) repeat protein
MSARARVYAVVTLAAAAAVGATVGVTLWQTHGEPTGPKARKGAPPLALIVARDDPLASAVALYRQGRRARAAAIFARYHSLPARIGLAFARWPDHSLDDVKRLVAENPQSALAELHLGLAYFWAGRDADAAASWRRTAVVGPDTPYAVSALDYLNPNVAPGLPPIVADLAAVAPAARARLGRGILLWDRERPVSAKRELDAAAAAASRDPVVRTAAAVAAYSPAHPFAPFPLLGPLTAAFPRASVVRLHLGLLLLWTRQVTKGTAQLRLAIAEEPGSVYATQARAVLKALGNTGTK